MACCILTVLTEDTGSGSEIKDFVTHSRSSDQKVSVHAWASGTPFPRGHVRRPKRRLMGRGSVTGEGLSLQQTASNLPPSQTATSPHASRLLIERPR